MTKLYRSYAPHLVVKEVTLGPGAEWIPPVSSWTIIQVVAGKGYWLQRKMNHQLEMGTVLLRAATVQGSFRASQLGGLSLQFIPIEPERLMGLCTLNDQVLIKAAESDEKLMQKVISAQSPISERMKLLCGSANHGRPSFRLQIVQLFFDCLGDQLQSEIAVADAELDAKERLRAVLKRTPASDLLDLGLNELAQMTRCTPRHLSRIFQEIMGMSFRDKHTELRLLRARELLAMTKSKIIDVALDSGYKSLSSFNLVFNRRFGMSPGRWRQSVGGDKKPSSRIRRSESLVGIR